MLDIIVLVLLGMQIAKMAKNKGRSPVPWVLMLVAFWFGGAIGFAVLAGIVTAVVDPNAAENDMLLIFVGAAIAGAVSGAVLSFVIVSMLPDLSDEYPRRGSRRRYDDEDDDYRARRRDDLDNERLRDPDEDRGRRYADEDRRRDYDR